MTRVLEILPVEDCFDKDLMREITCDEPIDEALIARFEKNGELEYFKDFPRPYFKFSYHHVCIVQGVLGNRTMRATLSRSASSSVLEDIVQLIEKGELHGRQAEEVLRVG